jgi:hypothetical protein
LKIEQRWLAALNTKGKTTKMNLRRSAIYGLQIAAFCFLASPSWAAPLQDWRFDPATNQLEVTVKEGIKPSYAFMARPARIILELPGTEIGKVKTQETYNSAVRQITVVQDRPGITQIILELAPTTVLSDRQLEFRQVSEADRNSDRWVLRPLVATAPKPVFSSVRTTPQATAPGIQTTPTGPSYPPGLSPEETADSKPQTSELPSIRSVKPLPTVNAPGQLTTPVVPTTPSSTAANTSAPFPTPVVPKAEVIPPTPSISQISSNSLQLSQVNPSLAIPDSLPPATPTPPSNTPTVDVPALNRAEPPQTNAAPFQIPETTAQPVNQPVNNNSLPFPLPDRAAVPNNPQSFPMAAPTQVAQSTSTVIDFGQPLFGNSPSPQPIPAQPPSTSTFGTPIPAPSYNNTGALLPAGTVLNLRYAGYQPLKLQNNQPRKEVLVLQNEIRDRNGYVLIPAGSSVFGTFETGGGGSRFIAQGISYQGRNFRLVGQSESLAGSRQVSDNRLIRNSGIGALAGAILGGFSGGNVLGGAAVGAGVTYAIAPRPATIQPNQVIPLKLTEDLR